MKKIIVSVAHHPGTPDHPKVEPGAISQRTGFTETAWSLAVSREIVLKLRALGYNTELVNLPLAVSRKYLLSLKDVSFLLEPHLNASIDERVDYGMAIIYGTLTHTSPRGNEFAENYKKRLSAWRGGKKKESGAPLSDRFVLAKMPKDARTLVHVGKLPIIEETVYPACITESGFISSGDFERVGCTESGMSELADVHVQAITDTFPLPKR